MIKPHDPAFPDKDEYQRSDGTWATYHLQGMSKREYYACAAMQGVLHDNSDMQVLDKAQINYIAVTAVALADALQSALAPAQPVNENESGGKG